MMRRILTILGVLIVVAGVSWAVVAWTQWRAGMRTAQLNTDVENLFVGLQRFKEHVGAYPSGNNAQIVKRTCQELLDNYYRE